MADNTIKNYPYATIRLLVALQVFFLLFSPAAILLSMSYSLLTYPLLLSPGSWGPDVILSGPRHPESLSRSRVKTIFFSQVSGYNYLSFRWYFGPAHVLPPFLNSYFFTFSLTYKLKVNQQFYLPLTAPPPVFLSGLASPSPEFLWRHWAVW